MVRNELKTRFKYEFKFADDQKDMYLISDESRFVPVPNPTVKDGYDVYLSIFFPLIIIDDDHSHALESLSVTDKDCVQTEIQSPDKLQIAMYITSTGFGDYSMVFDNIAKLMIKNCNITEDLAQLIQKIVCNEEIRSNVNRYKSPNDRSQVICNK
jgi:hypothetical protein